MCHSFVCLLVDPKRVFFSLVSMFYVFLRRVILDEAHFIKNKAGETARACRLLHAERRWAVTGTPIQNSLDDLLSLFMFFQYKPFDTPQTFRAAVGGNTVDGEQRELNIEKMHAILNPIILRRRKDTKNANGEAIVSLPPKTVKVVAAEFPQHEREFYDQLEIRMASRFKKMQQAGTVFTNYTNVLAMISRLRQACNHPHLVTHNSGFVREGESLLNELDAMGIQEAPKPPPPPAAAAAAAGSGGDGGIPQLLEAELERFRDNISWGPPLEECCPICLDVVGEGDGDAVITLCGHIFCRDCIVQFRDSNGGTACPSCRKEMSDADPFCSLNLLHTEILRRWPPVKPEPKPEPKDEKAAACAAEAVAPTDSEESKQPLKSMLWLGSAKLEELVSQLDTLTEADRDQKCIVFSNFTSFLNLVEIHLKKRNSKGHKNRFKFQRVDGGRSLDQRQKSLQIFRSDAKTNVLLMSLKAGSHGLNLTCAQNVILMEPWWNPMPEQQAMDRVHRTGQTKPVTVVRLTVAQTIEQRIIEMQNEKWELADSVLGEDSGFGVAQKSRKLTMGELCRLFGL